ncbi:hypothetical protein B0H13DRAFT_1901023 [Mycena leptocephala]|nr:hypothetical protein B0H13DRAFT_1901023 [Mycena leptocephala]
MVFKPRFIPSTSLTRLQDDFWYAISQLWTVLNLVLAAADIEGIDVPHDNLILADGMIYVVNNVIADALVIYRCYSVWNHNIYVIILPVILLITTSGRLVESGVIYSASVLTYLILGAIPSVRIVQEPVLEVLAQVVGIVPTLIIVRVGLGISVQSIEASIKKGSTLGGDNLPPKYPVLGIIRPASGSPYNLDKDIPSIPYDVDEGNHDISGEAGSKHPVLEITRPPPGLPYNLDKDIPSIPYDAGKGNHDVSGEAGSKHPVLGVIRPPPGLPYNLDKDIPSIPYDVEKGNHGVSGEAGRPSLSDGEGLTLG